MKASLLGWTSADSLKKAGHAIQNALQYHIIQIFPFSKATQSSDLLGQLATNWDNLFWQNLCQKCFDTHVQKKQQNSDLQKCVLTPRTKFDFRSPLNIYVDRY